MEIKTMNYIADDRNVQMIITQLLYHKVTTVVACPGAGCVTLLASIQSDSRFDIYSAIDERSAGYMACGLAIAKEKPVALMVTGNVATRNCVPAMTEAFYSNLPIILITTTHSEDVSGNGWPQVLDNKAQFNDISEMNVHLPLVHNASDEWNNSIQLNKAFLTLIHKKKPVQIFYATTYGRDYSCEELPEMQVVDYFDFNYSKEKMPSMNASRVVVYIGSHIPFSANETAEIEKFCENYNGVVFCDHTSNYHGKYRIQPSLVWEQKKYKSPLKEFDVMIHIGGISGQYVIPKPREVWRICEDGEIRDGFQRLRYVFKIKSEKFFSYYNMSAGFMPSPPQKKLDYYNDWKAERDRTLKAIPELPFSNAWIAQHSVSCVPEDSVIYLGILNSLRCWNFFDMPKSIKCISNVGAFGTDGGVSTLLGISLAAKDKICFGVVGDLSFFYDMNALGNRDLGKNFRVLLINNGMGTEFKNYAHHATSIGDAADRFVAAKGHFGYKGSVVKNYVEALGFEYLCASTKEEYINHGKNFWSREIGEKPMVFEVFTDSRDESEALRLMYTILR
jgi:2-succinyl-5-enolpyruvyl-6-hydroxy-3-cyclohexene-1-carboxylate synthase